MQVEVASGWANVQRVAGGQVVAEDEVAYSTCRSGADIASHDVVAGNVDASKATGTKVDTVLAVTVHNIVDDTNIAEDVVVVLFPEDNTRT